MGYTRIHVWVYHVLINDCNTQFGLLNFLHVIDTEKLSQFKKSIIP